MTVDLPSEDPRSPGPYGEGDGEHGNDIDVRVLVLRADELVLGLCCEDRVGMPYLSMRYPFRMLSATRQGLCPSRTSCVSLSPVGASFGIVVGTMPHPWREQGQWSQTCNTFGGEL